MAREECRRCAARWNVPVDRGLTPAANTNAAASRRNSQHYFRLSS